MIYTLSVLTFWRRIVQRPLILYTIVLAALAGLSVLDAAAGYLRTGRAGLFFLWMPYPAFDFVDYTLQFPYLHSRRFFELPQFPWVYPAPAIFVLYPFYKVAALTNRVVGFALFACCVLACDLFVAFRFRAAMVRRGLSSAQATAALAVTGLLGWPLYFSLQRGNIESLIWIGIAAGAVCFAKGRVHAAAVLWGAIGSVKLYPLVFLALLLRRKTSGPLVLGLCTAALTTLAGLRFLGKDVIYVYRQISQGVTRWTEITTLGSPNPLGGIGTDHSLLGLLRQITFGGVLKPAHALPLYLGISAAAFAAVYLFRVRHLPTANQTLFLTCTAILLPPTSFDYTLVLLFIPWGFLMLSYAEHRQEEGGDTMFRLPLLLFAVAFAPLAFLHTYGPESFYFEGTVRSLTLVALAIYSAWYPLEGARTFAAKLPVSE